MNFELSGDQSLLKAGARKFLAFIYFANRQTGAT
jgi:hypothetical protein